MTIQSCLRACVRRKFLNFSFLQVSEMFGFRSSDFFLKKPNFSNSRKFRENSSEISWEIISCFLSQKPLFLGQKDRKPLFWGQKQGFLNIRNLRKIHNLFYSELSLNYEKMTLKSNFGNCKKTRSDSKTNSNIRFKVWNAGPIS